MLYSLEYPPYRIEFDYLANLKFMLNFYDKIYIIFTCILYNFLLRTLQYLKKQFANKNTKVARVCKEHWYRNKAASVGQNGRLSASCNFFSFLLIKSWGTTN